jgi:hypothetical protein
LITIYHILFPYPDYLSVLDKHAPFLQFRILFSDRQTASSFSPAGQQETRPVTNHSAYSNILIEQSGSRTQKRPIAAVSDTEHSVGIPSAVNLKQTEGKRTGNRSKGTSFMSVTDQNANSAVDTGGTHSRRAKTRKT